MKRKACSSCAVEKDVDHFNRSKANRDGFTNQCRACAQAGKKRQQREQAAEHFDTPEVHGYGHGV